jgi:hypothetical protein
LLSRLYQQVTEQQAALSCLRQSVVNRSRSVLRHRVVVDRKAPKPSPDMPSAEQGPDLVAGALQSHVSQWRSWASSRDAYSGRRAARL